jgi:hypothetical protein
MNLPADDPEGLLTYLIAFIIVAAVVGLLVLYVGG